MKKYFQRSDEPFYQANAYLEHQVELNPISMYATITVMIRHVCESKDSQTEVKRQDGGFSDGINNRVSMTEASIHVERHRLWVDLDRWAPEGLLSEDTLYMDEYFSGFQPRYEK